MSRFTVLDDSQWALIERVIPSSNGRPGRPFRHDRRVIEGIIYQYWGTTPESVDSSSLRLGSSGLFS